MTVCLKRFELQVRFTEEPVTFSMAGHHVVGLAGDVEASLIADAGNDRGRQQAWADMRHNCQSCGRIGA
jgi:hypothetical protein